MGVKWYCSSGIAVQDFFAHSNKSAIDLTNIRMICAGFLLMILSWLKGGLKKSLYVLRTNPKLWLQLIIYGIIGMALMQFSYFEGIAIGGAVATTVIQYSCPAIVIIWDSLYYRQFPKRGEVLAVIFAMIGVFLLVTGGDLTTMIVPLACVIWSFISGAAFAFSSIFPKYLFAKQIDQYFLTSIGMIIGGLFTFLIVDEINWLPFFESDVIFDFIWIIIAGTVMAFLFYNLGLHYLTPEEASVTATTEPAASVIMAYFIFGATFGLIEIIGICLVIIAILSPTFIDRRK